MNDFESFQSVAFDAPIIAPQRPTDPEPQSPENPKNPPMCVAGDKVHTFKLKRKSEQALKRKTKANGKAKL